jgi:urease accessory protein
MLVLGRQARAENFVQGSYHNQFKLWRNKNYWLQIHYFLRQDRWLSSCLGMNNQAVMGSFWAVAPEKYRFSFYLEQQLELIRELMMRMDVPVTLTLLDDVVCARF